MSAINILEELQKGYLHTFPSQLEEMELLTLEIEKGNNFQENFEALYRRVHSIKGSGGTYGFTIISSICHQLEDFLTDEVDASTDINQSKINTIFAHIDLLKSAHNLLDNDKSNFSDIENSLNEIKTKSTNPTLRALIIGSMENLYGQICGQILENHHIQHSICTNSVTALQRLLHEKFDLLITSRENQDLSGIAVIAAIKLNRKNKKTNSGIQSILITSNPNLGLPKEFEPEYVVIKGKDFSDKLNQAIGNIQIKA